MTSIGQYHLEKVIPGHIDSVNVVSFSPDGRLFASGEDGLLRIFTSDFEKEIRRFQKTAPITALSWSERFYNTLLIGDMAGDVHIIRIGDSEVSSYFCVETLKYVNPEAQKDDVVSLEKIGENEIVGIAQRGSLLAIACGDVICVFRQSTICETMHALLLIRL